MSLSVFLSVAFVVVAMLFANASYQSYVEVKEAQQIEESYEIISDIKSLLAQQYDKNSKEITRDEIIAHLPAGSYWEKVLLINREADSTLLNDAFINDEGNIIISSDEKIKLLSLKNRLKKIKNVDNYTADEQGRIVYDVWMDNQSNIYKDNIIEKTIEKVENILYLDQDKTNFETILDKYTPYAAIDQNMLSPKDEEISDEELRSSKQSYFKKRLLEKLKTSKNTQGRLVYHLVKDL